MPMLIKDSQIIEDSSLVIASGFEGQLSDKAAIVPLTYWLENKELLKNRTDIGVWIDSHEAPEDLIEDLPGLPIIAINFPKFADGRGYSYARLLRERFNYQGEIRAIGDVLKDQLFYMKRCGFNAFSIRDDRDIHSALESLNDFTISYQAGCDNPQPLFQQRAKSTLAS